MNPETAVNHAWTLYHQLLDLQLQLWDVYEQDFMKITMRDPYQSTPRPKLYPFPKKPNDQSNP